MLLSKKDIVVGVGFVLFGEIILERIKNKNCK